MIPIEELRARVEALEALPLTTIDERMDMINQGSDLGETLRQERRAAKGDPARLHEIQALLARTAGRVFGFDPSEEITP